MSTCSHHIGALLRHPGLPLIPVVDDVFDQRHARMHEIGGRGVYGASHGPLRDEGVEGTLARIWSIEVRPGPQHSNTIDVGKTRVRPAGEGYQGRVVLLLRGAVDAVTVRQQTGPACRTFSQPLSAPPGIPGGGV